MQLTIIKDQETIEVAGTDICWAVATDDKSVTRMLNRLANAVARAEGVAVALDGAQSADEVQAATDKVVALQKAAIEAVVGEAGYQDVLAYMGDGDPVDPACHIVALGDVMAALCAWAYDHCSLKTAREATARIVGDA